MSWQYVEIDEVYYIHKEIIDRAGTEASIRDFSLLHSAVERPKASYGGRDLYPTVFSKAAALLHSLCLNHAFTNGNKRTAWVSTKRFLYTNGYKLFAEKRKAVEFLVGADLKSYDIAEIGDWLKRHSRKRRG